jgi:cobalamin biosynthesis Mg chelatase CobN
MMLCGLAAPAFGAVLTRRRWLGLAPAAAGFVATSLRFGAYQDMAGRMVEMIRKGYWNADADTRQRLLTEYVIFLANDSHR